MKGDTMTFGTRLKALRTDSGISVDQLSKQSGLSRAFIYQMENDGCDPSYSSLQKLSKGLGLTLAELLSENPQPKPDKLHRMIVHVHVQGPGENFDIHLLAWNPTHALQQAKGYLPNLPCSLKWEYEDAQDTEEELVGVVG
jgi:transcriptional regulator with XRE-family HTH domain